MSLNTHQTGQCNALAGTEHTEHAEKTGPTGTEPTGPPLPLYRFLVGNGGNRLIGRKDIIGEVEAVCLVDAILSAEKKFASVCKAVEVIEALVKRREPDGTWVDAEDWPETLEDALIYVDLRPPALNRERNLKERSSDVRR